jgi:hypothetical protein
VGSQGFFGRARLVLAPPGASKSRPPPPHDRAAPPRTRRDSWIGVSGLLLAKASARLPRYVRALFS